VKKQYIVVDVEADGPIPGDYSMVCFGAVLQKDTSKTFFGKLQPISENYIPEALAVSGYTRDETLDFPDPVLTMQEFETWILSVTEGGRPVFIADNNGFDWQFINWYFHHFLKRNPFGHSSSNINSLYHGVVRSTFKSFKHLRKTKHTHNPLDDALGNTEALNAIIAKYNVAI